MTLSELFLNRMLYKDNSQNLETKDSAFIAADSTPADPAGIPSGGAAQDINTGNVTINGAQLTPGTVPQATLDVSNWGWGQTCYFYSVDNNTVAWDTGTFKSADGSSYNITAGNTGNMAVKTYIYLSLLDSTTTYLTTTTPGTSVGIGKVLIAVANPDTSAATFNLSEATQLVGDNILANSINASKIVAGSITATQMTAATINAMNITAYDFSATNISGKTITGSTLQTGTSGLNINITAAQLQIRNNTSVIGTWADDGYGAGNAALTTNSIIANVVNTPLIQYTGTSNVQIASNFIPYSDDSTTLGNTSYYFATTYTTKIRLKTVSSNPSTVEGLIWHYANGATHNFRGFVDAAWVIANFDMTAA